MQSHCCALKHNKSSMSHRDFYFTSLLHNVAKLWRCQSGEHCFTDLDVHRYNNTCYVTIHSIQQSTIQRRSKGSRLVPSEQAGFKIAFKDVDWERRISLRWSGRLFQTLGPAQRRSEHPGYRRLHARGHKVIESSFKSSFELLDFLLDEVVRVRDRVRARVKVRSTFHRVDIPANIVLQISR